VISLHAAFRSHRAIFLVTELANGGELFDHIIARGHYTEPDAREITTQVLQAVKYLHEQDVIHRDIKPENILVSASASKTAGDSGTPVVKLSDFGLAKFIGDGAQMATTTCGTPTYSAPEVWKGAYTNKVDCYSVGVLMFVMLSGHFPKMSRDGPDFSGKVWNEISRDGRDLVQQLMERDPEKRISAKAALDHLWIVGDIPPTPLSSARERLRRASSFNGGNLLNESMEEEEQVLKTPPTWSTADVAQAVPTLAAPPGRRAAAKKEAATAGSSHSSEKGEALHTMASTQSSHILSRTPTTISTDGTEALMKHHSVESMQGGHEVAAPTTGKQARSSASGQEEESAPAPKRAKPSQGR